MDAHRRPGTRERLQTAAMHAVIREGRRAASVRSITRSAGVTEVALYRHYKGKDELFAAIYDRLVGGMIEGKQALVESPAPVRERLREWVRLTYRSFDADPDGFAYVFLTDGQAAAPRRVAMPPAPRVGCSPSWSGRARPPASSALWRSSWRRPTSRV
jgi:AcrR family transcriptional regulator